MKKIAFLILNGFLFFCLGNFSLAADENLKSNESELNFFTGMFDFSDHKQKAGTFGIQHQNDDLYRNSFLGKLSPISGGFLTEEDELSGNFVVYLAYRVGKLFLKIER